VQEGTLLRTVRPLLPAAKDAGFARLQQAWQANNLDRFRRSMDILASHLAQAAVDREHVPEQKWQDRVGGAIRSLGKEEAPEARRAVGKLAERLEASTRSSTEELIGLHGLSGKAAGEVLRRIGKDVSTSAPAREGFSAMLGGVLSGALGGLAADVAAGGLTLGGGMIVGGLLGAAGAGGLARGYNMVRGETNPVVRWSDDFLLSLVRLALLRYLAVAHFGRGRGQYQEGEHPAFWQAAVAEVVEARQEQLRSVWQRAKGTDPAVLTPSLAALLGGAAGAVLARFYPEASALFPGEGAPVASAPAAGEGGAHMV
jgi:hypothetical protein